MHARLKTRPVFGVVARLGLLYFAEAVVFYVKILFEALWLLVSLSSAPADADASANKT